MIPFEQLLFWGDMISIISFSISGCLFAINRKLDLLGVIIAAFCTAFGGGTLRDIVVGRFPVFWIQDPSFLYISLATSLLVVTVVKLRIKFHLFKPLKKVMHATDTLGIGLYTVIGNYIGIQRGLDPIVCIALGTFTATIGGLIRDTISHTLPTIMYKDIYASVCVVAGIFLQILYSLKVFDNFNYPALLTIIFVIIMRTLAIMKNWSLAVITIESDQTTEL